MADRKILVVVDPTSDKQSAVERAAWLAEKSGAVIELFVCDHDPDLNRRRKATEQIASATREALIERGRIKLEELAVSLLDRGLTVSIDVVADYPLVDGIVKKIRASNPWIVAKDTHHHSVIQRTFLTNTDWQLIRECSVPLLLVKERLIEGQPKILAAVDPLHTHDKPEELDDEIVGLSRLLAGFIGAELHVVHSYSVPIQLMVPQATRIDRTVDVIKREHEDVFSKFVERHQLDEDTAHLEIGAPHERLPLVAERVNAAIMVMGAISRSDLSRMFIGSTAERVLDRLPCDVLVVKGEAAAFASGRHDSDSEAVMQQVRGV